MDNSARRQWRIPEHANLVWRHWDGEYVFHHALSNDTHRLSEIAGQIVMFLATSGEHSEHDLAQHLCLDEIDTQDILKELANLDFVTCRS